jgi:hypothetical protein
MLQEDVRGTHSAFARRSQLFDCICRGELGMEIVNALLPSGQGLLYEKALWDYKSELPTSPVDAKTTESDKQAYNLKMAEIVKDAVSFYNSYGGYIIAGVDDQTRVISGFAGRFDCGDLSKKALGATRHEIDCHFALHDIETPEGPRTLGILFVPRRPYSKSPAQFLRDAPISDTGKQAYKKNQIYFRFGDECRAAQTSEDYGFLCGAGRRELSFAQEFRRSHVLTNNLGPRDPGFIKFIGRETYLKELWRWLCDGFMPIKLLAGIGGVGKTTLAREFAEDLIRNPPTGLEKLIWLSAKKQLYTAILGEYRPTSRVDFSDIRTLLEAILGELSYPINEIDPEWSVQELADECVKALRMFPSVLIVDDVDSLEPMQQQEVFQTMIQIAAQTLGHGAPPSLTLLTARLDLGAAPAQLIRVTGLDLQDFSDYVQMTASTNQVPLALNKQSALMKKFRDVTDGSPTFAASIIRMLTSGEQLEAALKRWTGSGGDEVRNFAFKKELDKLSESQVRTLCAACLLGETSFVELQSILQSNDRLMADDIGMLRKYHLVVLGEDLPGGARIVIPSSLQLVMDIIRERVRDPRRIERECAKARAGTPRLVSEIGDIINRVTALWHERQFARALELALVAEQRYPNDGDIQCLLGRAFLVVQPPDPAKADAAFHKAFDLRSQRLELPSLWINAKSLLNDWMGIMEVCQLFPKTPELLVERARAFWELGNIGLTSHNPRRAAELWLQGAREVDRAFKEKRAQGREAELKHLRRLLLEHYVLVIDSLTREPNERIDVWSAAFEAFSCFVRHAAIVKTGVEALAQWWSAVESRSVVDTKARGLMQSQLRKMDNMIGEIVIQANPDPSLISYLNSMRSILQERVNSCVG